MAQKAIVFYDGGCPLCRREIAHYRRVDRSGRIHWVDITRDQEALAAHGLAFGDAMARLHVLDREGIWQTGVRAFIAIWTELPRYRWMAQGLQKLKLLALLERVYTPFAKWRYGRRCAEHPGQ